MNMPKMLAATFFLSVLNSGIVTNAQEKVLPATITVEHGDYITGGDGYGYCEGIGSHQQEDQMTQAAATAIAQKFGVKGVAGVLAVEFLKQQFRQQISQSGGSGKELLEMLHLVESYAACGPLSLAAPIGARILDVRAYASEDGGEMKPCPQGSDGRFACSIGWSEWVWHQDGRFVSGIFKNWSHDRTRKGKLEVVYEGGAIPIGQKPTTTAPCTSGIYTETNADAAGKNSFKWIFKSDAENLTIRRNDNFVRGVFKWIADDYQYTGTLKWGEDGKGDEWKDITLTPDENCKSITTNRSWGFLLTKAL